MLRTVGTRLKLVSRHEWTLSIVEVDIPSVIRPFDDNAKASVNIFRILQVNLGPPFVKKASASSTVLQILTCSEVGELDEMTLRIPRLQDQQMVGY
jgi:hypothetical protein